MTSTEARFHYPVSNLWPDYLRAALGFGLTLLPMPYAINGNILVMIIVFGLSALFLSFGISTFIRQKSVVATSDQGIWIEGPRSKAIKWDEVSEVDLRFFSTRKDREKGWLQMKISGPNTKIKADSNLDDFDGLLQTVVKAIARHDLTVSPIGRENFASMGQPLPLREDTA